MSNLPDGWVAAPLGELLSAIVGGGTPSKSNADYFRGTIPFMTVKDMHERFIADTQDHITGKALESSASSLIPADTLVVASRMSLGKIARLQAPVAINQDLKALFLHEGIDKTYIEYAWRAKESQIQAMGTGTTVKGIRLEDIRGLEIPVAPSSEQTRIADQLDKLLARIQACNDHIDAIPALLKRFRQAVREAAMSGTLTEDWQTASNAPEWRETDVQSVAYVGTGSTPLRSNPAFFASSGTPWVTSAATSMALVTAADEYVTEAAISAHRLKTYPVGTLLVAMYGEGKTRGQVTELGIPATINQACAAVVVDSTKVLKTYVKLALQANYFEMRELAEGGNQPNLNLSKIKEFPLPLPCMEEQAEIVRLAEALFKLADRIEARHTAARAQARRLTPLLLAKAFRGELVQQDPQDEPASVLLQRIAATPPTTVQASRGRPRIQPKQQSATPELAPTDWATLPDGAWAAPPDPDGLAAAVWLTAVLRARGEPMPEQEARLAALLCQQPRLFTATLPTAQATQWSRLVGDEARPLPTQVVRFQPAINSHWGRAIKGMRARGDLVEAGLGDDITWALGPGTASIETAGWPDGRAGFVVAYLRAHGIASVLPSLEFSAREFVDARAA